MIFAPDSACTYQDSDGGKGRQRPSRLFPNGNSYWYGAAGSRFLVSCLIRQTLAGGAFDRNGFALHVIDPQLGARVLPEIKFRQIAVKMLGIDVLVNADPNGMHPEESELVKLAVGEQWMVTCCTMESVCPRPSVTINFTLNVPQPR